jgi:hypothetical protein
MATIDVDDIVQVIQTWDTPLASVAQNVWHLKQVSGAGADSDDILAAILTQQQVAFVNIEDEIYQGFEAVLLELRKWDFVNDRFDGVGSLAMTDVVGLSAIDYEPHQVAAYGRIVTEVARRQGGTYIPGLNQNAIASGVLVGSAEASVAAYLAVFDTDISVTGGLLSWCTFNVDPESPLFETASIAAQTVIANSLPSTLGKRKPGVGL